MPSTTRYHLGVDPGDRSGAAVLLAGLAEVVGWGAWAWRPRGDRGKGGGGGGRYVTVLRDRIADFRCLEGAINDAITALRPRIQWLDTIAIEGLYVGDRKGGGASVASVLPVAESVGIVRAVCYDLWPVASVAVARPSSRDWRRRQLGLPEHIGRSQLEGAAVRLARQAFTWPGGWPDLPRALQGAVAEAAWIARDGATVAPVA